MRTHRSSTRVVFALPSVAAIACAVTLLAGCGGGGGGGGSSVSPVGQPTSAAGGGGGTAVTAPATVAVSFQQYTPVTTSSVRRTKFISPATQSMTLSVVSVNGVAVQNGASTTFNVTPISPNCTTSGGTVSCTAPLNVPVGSVVLAATSFSGLLGAGNVLGNAMPFPVTIASNSANRIALSISGIIASLQFYLNQQNFSTGVPARSLAILVPLDSSGAVIVNPGTYSPAIAVQSSDLTGHFSLLLNGTNVGRNAAVTGPGDQLALNYDGVGSPSTTLRATAGAVTGAVSASAGSPPLIGAISGNTIPRHFQLTVGQTGTVTVSGGVPPYTATSSDPTAATVTPASGTGPFTVTAVGFGAGNASTATITISDSASSTFTNSVTIVQPTITVVQASCGTAAACSSQPPTSLASIGFTTGAVGNLSSTFNLAGGVNAYSFQFLSSGSTNSQHATASIAGNSLTITPNGAGSDTLVVTSGAQTDIVAILANAGGAGYSLASAAHAYSPAANSVTLAPGGTATLTTTIGNGPWSVSFPTSCAGIATVSASNSGFVVSAVGPGTCSAKFTPAVGSIPPTLNITTVPAMTVSPNVTSLHALNDNMTLTVNNGTATGLALAAGSIFDGGNGVVHLDTYVSPTIAAHAVGFGSATITVHDTNLDETAAVTVNVDNAFAQAITAQLATQSQPSPIGVRYTSPWSFAIPASVISCTHSGGFTISPACSGGSLTATPSGAGHGTVTFADAIGGSTTLPYTNFGFNFGAFAGSANNAAADVAFTATTGQSQVVTVSGTSSSPLGGVSSNTTVVTVSGLTSNTMTLTPVGVGNATITVTDPGDGVSTTFSVSVTTTTIPVLDRHRQQ